MSEKIAIGVFIKSHGIKGALKFKSFTDPIDNVFNYKIFDKLGNQIKIKKIGVIKELFIVAVENINDKSKSDELKGEKVYTNRNELPKIDKNEFYYSDLIGIKVNTFDYNGKKIDDNFGIVKEIHNFGASDVIEIKLNNCNSTEMFNFHKNMIVDIDLENGILHLITPKYFEDSN